MEDKDFFDSLPPDARRLVEDLDRGKKPAPSAKAPKQMSESFSDFESMIMGGEAPKVQAEDRMFEEPEPAEPPARRKGRSMRELIESIEGK